MGCERQKIILHIGHGKTGSSYIQSSLALTAGRLREAGIEYPELRPFTRAKQGRISSGNLGHAKNFVQTVTERWRQHYNTVRPHSALGYRPPAPEARQPCAVASAKPRQPHRAGLLEGKPLT
jgi:transposase InsO family protein